MIKALWRTVLCGALLVTAVGCQQPLKVGATAPDFTGMTDEGREFQLSKNMGEEGAVIYFYPKDETPGCITQACAFRDRLGKLADKGYTVIGISLDSVDSHKTFKAKYKLPFTLISDPQGDIAKKFGVPLERKELGGEPVLLAQRQTFILDENRNVENHFTVEDPEEQVRQTFQALEVPY